MCPFPVGTAPLLTTNSTFVPPITGKGPPVRCLQSTNEAPRLFMPIDENSLPPFSSDLLSLLPECSHLTSFDLIASTPPPTVLLNESSEHVFIRAKTPDKNIKNQNYTKGQEGRHPLSPSPGSGDAVLSCWETGSQFSYHGCDLGAFGPIPCQSQRRSTMIPDREHDAVVRQRFGQFCAQRIQNNCFAPRMHNKVLMPDPLVTPQVQMREVEDLEKSEGRVRDSIFMVANHGFSPFPRHFPLGSIFRGLNFTHQRINVEQLPSDVSSERQPSFQNCVGDYQISLNPLSLLLISRCVDSSLLQAITLDNSTIWRDRAWVHWNLGTTVGHPLPQEDD
ncbi:hypothetical protein F5876DRAFT_62553 [Lentinula aff. lateritia]|uniref:Uncharacterized protein n=1 Tax=Lentinula aff. lateritia TaxID=2804960 RepID=A0ACC1UAL7_9AGAR|nr:hypothetical protein F5876DRAFT_62553 [Lentinula aff. lateritia]